MSTAVKITTADELFRMPENESWRCELVEGGLRKMTPAGSEHGIISAKISMRLGAHVEANYLGQVFASETGFLIARNPDTVLAPDCAFVRQERLDEVGIPQAFFPEAPALVVEVVSPGDTIEEVDLKMRRWFVAGVEIAWVVHPGGRTVTVYHSMENIQVLTQNDTLVGSQVIPGFECLVADLFAGL